MLTRPLSHLVAGITGICFVVLGFSLALGFRYPTEHLYDFTAVVSALGLGCGVYTLIRVGT